MKRLTTFLLGVAMAPWAGAQVFEMDILETEDLRLLYFDPPQTYLVPHAARSAHNSLDFQKDIFQWSPWDKPTLILTDFSDYGNAGAGASPYNGLIIDIAPLSFSFETIVGSERIFSTMNHELVHIANLDAWNAQDARWRRFFGGKPRQTGEHPETILYNYLTTPRMNVPRWYTEGAAVFMETWMAAGAGRAQGAYDEMVFRAKVRDDAHFYSALGLVSEGTRIDFQVGTNAYLYGTRFMGYLALEYGPTQVVEWLSRGEDSKRYYARQFEHVFGLPLETAWDQWIAWEQGFQRANLSRIREEAISPVTPLVDQALGSISRAFLLDDGETLVGGFRYPGVVAHIGALSLATGEVDRLADIKGPMLYRVTSTALDRESGTLFYTADNASLRDLMALDLATGDEQRLLRDARIGDLAFNAADGSLWGLRHLNGFVTLVRLEAPYDSWTQVHSWPYGKVLYELDVSPDGRHLSVSVGEFDGSQHLRVFRTEDLLAGKVSPVNEFNFGTAIPEGFVFSPDGRYLFGSSYYTGVSNIFRYELATGDLEAVSNAETGLFRPIPREDGKLVVLEFTGQGFRPGLLDPVPLEDVSAIRFLGNDIAVTHPEVREWSVIDSLASTDFESRIVREGKYRPYRELGFTSNYPMVQGYRDEIALGWAFQVSDPAQLHQLNLDVSYSWESPSDERLHVDVEYRGLGWFARYWHNKADFYDLFGPTERARKGDAFIVGYDKTLIFDEPRTLEFTSQLAWYTGLDTLPDNQNRPTFFIDEILSLDLGLHYENTRKSLGAVDHEKGWRWSLDGRVDRSDFDTIPKLRGGLDFGFALPWKHSSIWFYNTAGWADGNRLDPLTNYYFGGFGNNYVDDREIKRYREYYSLPGFEIGEIGGREFAKVTAEWNLPPLRFRRAGTPSFFLQHLRPAVFAMGLVTDPGERFERTFTSYGVQLDLQFTLVHRLPMTLSVGWGVGFEEGDRRDDEWMLSLKIL